MVYSKDSCLHAKYQAKRLKRTKVMILFMGVLNVLKDLNSSINYQKIWVLEAMNYYLVKLEVIKLKIILL